MKRNRPQAPEDGGRMSLAGHLGELRKRAAVCAAALALCFLVCLGFAGPLVNALTGLGRAYGYRFVYLAPQELLLVYCNLALTGALALSFPVLACELYAFCRPGLRPRERRAAALALPAGTLCFLLGAAFARFVTLPLMLRFLIGFSAAPDVAASIRIQEYVSFLLTVFVIFGAVFELPVVSVLLTALGVLKAAWLAKGRRAVIVLCFVLGALLTPPDVVSQLMAAVPMIGLYELSILLSRLAGRAKRERPAADGEQAARRRRGNE